MYRLDFYHGPAVKYLILSHTWGDNEDEVSYQDMANLEMAQKKKGFQKIVEICARARQENIPYAWVDTCCIDKTSSAELSESINSMYYWYDHAEYCVAYLDDFQAGSGEGPKDSFRLCRWFTRGWTLQELIAPKSVVFVDKEWKERGTKSSLGRVLSSITGVSKAVLDGTRPLHTIAVAQRMSWAAQRQTTRTEDMAYCLLGIFDINMPLLYGEGQKAFVRFQQEVLQRTGDLSVFAWDVVHNVNRGVDPGKTKASYLEVAPFAPEPVCFQSCGKVERFTSNVLPSPSVSVTSAGVRFLACVITRNKDSGDGDGHQLLHLQCKIPTAVKKGHYVTVTVPLEQVPGGYLRWADTLKTVKPLQSLGISGSESRQVINEICLVSGTHLRSIILASQGKRPASCIVTWDTGALNVIKSYYPQHLWDSGSSSFYAEWSDVFLGAVEVVLPNDPPSIAATGSAGRSTLWILCGMALVTVAAEPGPGDECGRGKDVNRDDNGMEWEFWAAILRESEDGSLPDLAPDFQGTRLRNPYTLADLSSALRTGLSGAHAKFPRTCRVPYGGAGTVAFTARAIIDEQGKRQVHISTML